MDAIERQVEELFNQLPRPAKGSDRLELNPVTGSQFFLGADPIGPQKRAACRALRARELFAKIGPPDLPPLPLSYWDIENMRYKQGPLLHLLANYARSVKRRDWDLEAHPPFEVYAGGVHASPYLPEFMRDEGVMKRFPPSPISGEIDVYLVWKPSKDEKHTRASRQSRKPYKHLPSPLSANAAAGGSHGVAYGT
jgi:hypothetical protein